MQSSLRAESHLVGIQMMLYHAPTAQAELLADADHLETPQQPS